MEWDDLANMSKSTLNTMRCNEMSTSLHQFNYESQ